MGKNALICTLQIHFTSGYLKDVTGSYDVVYLCIGCLVVISTILLVIVSLFWKWCCKSKEVTNEL